MPDHYPWSIQLLHAVTGVHGVLYTQWENGNLKKNPIKTLSQRATIVLLYGNIITPLLEVLFSSLNIIYDEYA